MVGVRSLGTLSEAASKALLAAAGVPFAREHEVSSVDAAIAAATEIGGAVVVKLCGSRIAHKTERGLVRLNVEGVDAVRRSATELLAAATPDDGPVSLLVAEMISGPRELIAGVVRDPQFGPNVMLGLGGILAEAIADVQFRPAPLSPHDADGMIDGLVSQSLLGPFRGEAAVDRRALRSVLEALSTVAVSRPDVVSIDLNPLVVDRTGRPVAVDALVELGDELRPVERRSRWTDAHFRALFEPRGVLVAGASTHPGKFGFVGLHNILASGYGGRVVATNLQGETVLDVPTVRDVADIPEGAIDLAFVCTPATANEQLLRACAAKGVRAAFVTSAGYGEAGDEGRQAEARLVELAEQLDVLLAGPNGQGVVSTPVSLCAQIVAPAPPPGSIAVASQSGNFVSSFLNYARQTGVGISRAVSAGNAAVVGPADYLRWYASDETTRVALAYVESVVDGASLAGAFGAITAHKPLVVVKGGATASGARAAASHTGALAADDRIFDGVCRQHGVTRAASVEEAFEAAATFATQPLPRGPRTVVLTTAGGWGVVTSDAVHRDGTLQLMTLPEDLRGAIDGLLPPRWSRSNPVDCAGGETRDTIPDLLELIAAHPEVDAIVYLGLGIQSNQARLMREGRFYPDHGLERIVAYHERQDERFAAAADEVSRRHDIPVLTATELAVADPENPGPRAVRATGRLCYPSGERAVVALGHLVRYAAHRHRLERAG